MPKSNLPIIKVPEEIILEKIYMIHGAKVMLDSDLAEMYGVEVRVLNQAVKRNATRFPDDFMFQINRDEFQVGEDQEHFLMHYFCSMYHINFFQDNFFWNFYYWQI